MVRLINHCPVCSKFFLIWFIHRWRCQKRNLRGWLDYHTKIVMISGSRYGRQEIIAIMSDEFNIDEQMRND